MSGKNGDPKKTEPNGRDDKGRFAPGNPGGPGRPRRIDLISAAKDYARKHKVDLDEALATATITMLEKAKEGDVNAYKAVADRLAGPVKQELDHTTDGKPLNGTGPDIPTGEALNDWLGRLADLRKNGDSG